MAKLTSFQASVACVILKGIAAFFQLLPHRAALWIGRRMGEMSFWLNPKSRRKAYQNLRIAFGTLKSDVEMDRIIWEMHRAFGQNAVEVARLTRIARDGIGAYVSVEGREHVDAAMAKGRGLIFLSIHSGNWELSNMAGSLAGYPYNMVANYLEHVNKVADLLDSWRKSGGCRIINPGIGGREIIKALKRNEIVTLVADQGGSDGMPVPFFGRDASMSTGAVRIALKYDVPICLVDIHRLPDGKHYLKVVPFDLRSTGDTENDVRSNMAAAVKVYEQWIVQHPAEFLWFYKSWKHGKDRAVVILDDGRTGHLRQAQAVARQAALVMKARGLKPFIQEIRIEWRGRARAAMFKFLAPLLSFAGLGVKGLRPFLTDDSFRSVAAVKPDVLVSAGARNSWANVLCAADNDAVNICVLRPGGASMRDFDLVVLPGHDAPGAVPSNVVVTRVAPSLIDQAYLDENVRGLTARFSHLKLHGRPRIGLFIGGDTKGLVLSEQQVRVVIHQLKEAAGKYSADILVTTSRRTSAEVEALVAREFGGSGRSALMILAGKNNVPDAVGGILGLSDIVVVSGESISMVSEAAVSGRKTVVFLVDGPDRKPLDNKYSRFDEMLGHNGHVLCARTTGVLDAVDRLLRDKVKIKPVNDNAAIAEAVGKIVR
jgi:KDO2-lipid IV(A) lauroyltransferase